MGADVLVIPALSVAALFVGICATAAVGRLVLGLPLESVFRQSMYGVAFASLLGLFLWVFGAPSLFSFFVLALFIAQAAFQFSAMPVTLAMGRGVLGAVLLAVTMCAVALLAGYAVLSPHGVPFGA